MKASCLTIILIGAQQLSSILPETNFFPLLAQWNFFSIFESIFQNQLQILFSFQSDFCCDNKVAKKLKSF